MWVVLQAGSAVTASRVCWNQHCLVVDKGAASSFDIVGHLKQALLPRHTHTQACTHTHMHARMNVRMAWLRRLTMQYVASRIVKTSQTRRQLVMMPESGPCLMALDVKG